MFFGHFEDLTYSQKEKLKTHKYSRVGSSLIEPYMAGWWEWVIKHTPKNIAPNMLTLIGFLFMVSSTIIMVYFSPRMLSNIPWWVNLYACISLFIYQTLDAIDGKQARRLSLSSSLGEFFDHGCDAVVVFLISINLGCCVVAAKDIIYFKYAFWSLFLSLYCTHWSYYVTGSFHFTQINVTEGQIAAMLLHLFSSIFGSDTYHIKIFDEWTYYRIACTFITCSTLFSFPYYFTKIVAGGRGKNGSSVANTSIVSPIIPFIFVCLIILFIDNKSNVKLTNNYPVELISIVGLVVATLSTKLLLSTIAEAPFPLYDFTLVNLTMLGVAVRFGSDNMEMVALYSVLILMIICYSSYFYDVCIFMSNILNTPVLSIPKRTKK